MSDLLLERIHMNREEREKIPEPHIPRVLPDLSHIADQVGAEVEAIEKNSLETVPRETVLKMLCEKKMDEHFIFSVQSGEAENYIQAMRQVLSRTRKKALRKKKQLSEFKMLIISVEKKKDQDVVTLVRTKMMSEHQESVYDELIAAFEKPRPTQTSEEK